MKSRQRQSDHNYKHKRNRKLRLHFTNKTTAQFEKKSSK